MTSFDLDIDTQAVKERIRQLKDDYSDAPTFVVSSGAEYSIYVEMGTRDMPPYPFFRPAVREFKANPKAFLLKNTELNAISDIDSADELVESVALALEKQIKINATAAAPNRSPGVDPDHPKVQTGNLRARIQAQRVG